MARYCFVIFGTDWLPTMEIVLEIEEECQGRRVGVGDGSSQELVCGG